MPLTTDSEKRTYRTHWLTRVWRLGIILSLVTAGGFLWWKAQHNQGEAEREAQLWNYWINGVIDQSLTPPSTSLVIDSNGNITRSQPVWLGGLPLNKGSFGDLITQGIRLQSAVIFPALDLATKRPGVFTGRCNTQGCQLSFLPLKLLSAHTTPDFRTFLISPQGLVTLSSADGFINTRKRYSQLEIIEGSIFYFSGASLERFSGWRVVVGTDVTLIVGIITLLMLIFFTSYFTLRYQLISWLHAQQKLDQGLQQLTRSIDQLQPPLTHVKLQQFAQKVHSLSLNDPKLESLKQFIYEVGEQSRKDWNRLQDKQNQYEQLLLHFPAGIFFLDNGGIVTHANPGFCQFINLPLQRIEGQHFGHFLEEKDEALLMTNLQEQRPTNTCLAFKSEKTPLFGLCVLSYLGPNQKDFQWLGMIVDVSESTVEHAKLRKMEARWQFALESSDIGVWDWNILTGETYFSDQLANSLGYAPQSLPPSMGELINRVHHDDVTKCNKRMEGHLAGETDYFECEHRIRCEDGSYKWVINKARVVSWDDAGKPARLIGTLLDVTERHENENRIQYLAYHDSLTNLPNRTFLTDELKYMLAQLERNGMHSALLFLDIDHFKMINDSMGHLTGDEMLRQVAQRLKENIREGDILVRLGGDEFVIVLGNPADDPAICAKRARKVADNILVTFRHPFYLNGQNVVSGTSIGIVSFPVDGSSVDEVLQHADTAMYEAKNNGRNRYHFYRAEMALAIRRRVHIENALRDAIENNELSLVYQPKICMDAEQVIGAEALLRWFHKGEFISPAEFIPIAEETGLIIPLGEWIMREAICQVKAWKHNPSFDTFDHLAVNVSPLQFSQPEFAEQTLFLLKELDADPHLL